ncbi:MAG: hypothetical protein KAX24_07855, partial [Anaerolineae bacterium]|nr:hypothetical protein [Anaerolineae bacterium]
MGRSRKRVRRSSGTFHEILAVGLAVLFLVIAGAAGLFVFDQVRQFIAASDMLPDFTIEHNEADDVS